MNVECNNCDHKDTIEISEQDKSCGFSLGFVCSKCKFSNAVVFRNGKWIQPPPMIKRLLTVKVDAVLFEFGNVPENFY